MTALLILGGIVLFFALLLSLNLKLDIAMLDEVTIRGGVGPVMLTLSPKKKRVVDPRDFTYKKHQKRLEKDRKIAEKRAEKKRRKAETKEAKQRLDEQEKSSAKDALETADRKKFPIGFVLALVKFVLDELDVFAGYFRTEIVALHVTVGGKDAAAVGKNYGYLSQSAAYLVEFLRCKTRMKRLKADAVKVEADFLREKTVYRIHIRLRLPLFGIVKVGCHTLGWFIGQKIAQAKRSAPPPQSENRPVTE